MNRLRIVVVGLGFGGSFPVIYRDHPDVEWVGICDPNTELMHRYGKENGIGRMYDSLDDVLRDPEVDAVHLVSPIPLHGEQAVAVMRSGKHCACTVPMATSLEDIGRIVKTARETGKRYMFMETTLYTYQFLYVKEMVESGRAGRIQFLRGSHYQDMENWPDYWMGLPPMWYGTHAMGPMIAISGSRVKSVTCYGSGTMSEELQKRYGNPYPVESAHLIFENGLVGEATRSLFETARVYQEGFFLYGSRASFEWGFADGDDPYVTTLGENIPGRRGRNAAVEQIVLPNYADRLPEPIRRYTVGGNFDPLRPEQSLKVGRGGGHHGSHPHLVHEFVRSILEERRPAIDEVLGANITAAGVCAHMSAMRGGRPVDVPEF